MLQIILSLIGFTYQAFVKPVFFLRDPEIVHETITTIGEVLGKSRLITKCISPLFSVRSPLLRQTVAGIQFDNPIGLAAGFDYDAKLTQVLPSLGFGFETVGTITNHRYVGNPRPMLGRLPQSQSLMVNKGFKNEGAEAISQKLNKLKFSIPMGVSIGRTNTVELKTQKQSIDDIIKAFRMFESSNVLTSYYELNISCPNLMGDISFYPPKHLDELLEAVDTLRLKKPVFIKMPIEKRNEEVLQMLQVIARHSPTGVIFGNLQKDRNHPSLVPEEVAKFPKGYFSGKPTFDRSNELISLAYKHYKNRFIIIGCGGVFCGKDAYEKIKRGATLVQLITGLIYEGPQLVAQINHDLVELLKKDGFSSIAEAVGTARL